jgi:hypothetical protein
LSFAFGNYIVLTAIWVGNVKLLDLRATSRNTTLAAHARLLDIVSSF